MSKGLTAIPLPSHLFFISIRPRPLSYRHPRHSLAMANNNSNPSRATRPPRAPPPPPPRVPPSKLDVAYLLNSPSPDPPPAHPPPDLGPTPTVPHSRCAPAFRIAADHPPALEPLPPLPPLPPPPSRVALPLRAAPSQSPPLHESSSSSGAGPSAAESSAAIAPEFFCAECKRVFSERGNVRHSFGSKFGALCHVRRRTARTAARARFVLTFVALFLFTLLCGHSS